MAIAYVQSAVASAGSVAYGSNNTAGNLLVAVIQDSNDHAGIGLTDTQTNTWVKAASASLYSAGLALSLSIWYVENCAAGANTVTESGGFDGFRNLAVAEYSGIATASALDQGAIVLGELAEPDSGNVTTTQADELLIGGVAFNGNRTITWGGSFTGRQSSLNGGSNRYVSMADRIVSATGTYSAGGTKSGTTNWMAAIATFKAAADAPVGLPWRVQSTPITRKVQVVPY